MPQWLRYISYCMPGTLPAEAMRGIMGRGKVWQIVCVVAMVLCKSLEDKTSSLPSCKRSNQDLVYLCLLFVCFAVGWGLEHESVWLGFVVAISWFIVFLLLSGVTFSLRR